jgi:hypothetical protein
MVKRLISVFVILFLQCSPNNKLMEFGKTFFSLIDQGKYDIAFNMLSDEDKQFSSSNDFSLKLQELKDHLFYPDKLDTNTTCSLSSFTDTMLKQAIDNKTPLPTNAKSVFIYKELRRIPDLSTIRQSSSKEDYFTRRKETAEKLISGNYPTVLDSGRHAILMILNNKPCVYAGAKYWKARDTLLELYSTHLKRNLSISIIGNAQIYQTVSYSVVGKISFELKNSSRDTLGCYSIKVKGKFDDIPTEPTYLIGGQENLLPQSKSKDDVVFSDDFFRNLLGYSRDIMFVKGEIEIIQYPHLGNGADYDSIMALKPNAYFEQFSMPVKQGVSKLLAGL